MIVILHTHQERGRVLSGWTQVDDLVAVRRKNDDGVSHCFESSLISY